MFFKRTSRPAFACATASAGAMGNQSMSDKKYENFAFASSQSDDFNSFGSSSSARTQKSAPKRPNQKKVTFEIPGKRIAIITAVIIAIIVVAALVIGLLLSKSGDVMYEDNTFIAYQEHDGTYRIAMNGKVLKDVFTGEVKLTPAKNNAFAYVEALVEDKTNVYILDNNKLTLLCEGIDNVLALAEYVPGVVYKDDIRVEYYFDDTHTSLADKDDHIPENFVISPDGTAVSYTKRNKNNSEIKDLYLCTSDRAMPKAITTGTISMVPVALSNNGENLVAYVENADVKTLYLISDNSKQKISGIDGSFESLTAINADSTEMVFTAKNGADTRTYVYNCTETKKGESVAYSISVGVAVPQITNPAVCTRESFKKCYFQNNSPETPLTLYVNKKYEAIKISDYVGKIDPEEKYLYVINNQRGNNQLIQIKLLGEKSGKNTKATTTQIASGVKDFVITNKGNIYYKDTWDDLFCQKISKTKPSKISKSINEFVFYDYSNQVLFEKSDVSGVSTVYTTEEGSSAEEFAFGKIVPTSLPTFTNAYSKKSYVYYYDENSDTYTLFYTSNGKSFSKVAECDNILLEQISNPVGGGASSEDIEEDQ